MISILNYVYSSLTTHLIRSGTISIGYTELRFKNYTYARISGIVIGAILNYKVSYKIKEV